MLASGGTGQKLLMQEHQYRGLSPIVANHGGYFRTIVHDLGFVEAKSALSLIHI